MIIEAEGLVKSYGATPVLKQLDLAVPAGTVLALLGPNGAGKTTTVRILSTLLRPDAGRARVAGFDVRTQAAKVREVISLTGQSVALDELQTAEENLVMLGRLLRLSRRQARQRADELLRQFDLYDVRKRLVRTYSGGMRRRLDLAAGLIGQPKVIFLDEPTAGLDPASRLAMWAAVRDLVEAGATVLLTTQYLEEADQLADHIALIDGGRVVAEGTAEQLKSKIGTGRLDLRFDNLECLLAAGQVLGQVVESLNQDALCLSVVSDGSAQHVKSVLDVLADRGVAAAQLSLHKPTLDDVFLSLTGTAATSANVEAA